MSYFAQLCGSLYREADLLMCEIHQILIISSDVAVSNEER